MSDIHGAARTNYFRVKDLVAFVAWAHAHAVGGPAKFALPS